MSDDGSQNDLVNATDQEGQSNRLNGSKMRKTINIAKYIMKG